MTHQLCIVLDPGSPYSALLARRVRACGVYCEVLPADTPAQQLLERGPVGLLLAGGAGTAQNLPFSPSLLTLGIPVLGTGSGALWLMAQCGGMLRRTPVAECGSRTIRCNTSSVLFGGIQMPEQAPAWMHHAEQLTALPRDFTATAHAADGTIAAAECPEWGLCALLFHPEMPETHAGLGMLDSFLKNLCGCTGDWTMDGYAQAALDAIRAHAPAEPTFLPITGDARSLTAAALLSAALGNRFTAVFVDHGFYRRGETEEIVAACRDNRIPMLHCTESLGRFLHALSGIHRTDEKRAAFRACMARAQGEAIAALTQGAPYRVLSAEGSLPEGLIPLYPDEVQRLGQHLGLPRALLERDALPEGGLACRMDGEVTREKRNALQYADHIFRQEIARAGLGQAVGAHGAALIGTHTIALQCARASALSSHGFAALPSEVLAVTSARITREVPGMERVVYEITL